LVLEIGLDGRGYLFSESAAEWHDGRLLIYEDQVAGLTVRFLSVLGERTTPWTTWGPST
jgi:hypothetical protein